MSQPKECVKSTMTTSILTNSSSCATSTLSTEIANVKEMIILPQHNKYVAGNVNQNHTNIATATTTGKDDKTSSSTSIMQKNIVVKNAIIEEIKGDLFTCAKEASLAHCVSRCLSMSKGIAVTFKQKFG